MTASPTARHGGIESPYAWTRLFVSLLLMTIGGAGMYSITVVLPRIQAEFGVARADAALPYTLTKIVFGCRQRVGSSSRSSWRVSPKPLA